MRAASFPLDALSVVIFVLFASAEPVAAARGGGGLPMRAAPAAAAVKGSAPVGASSDRSTPAFHGPEGRSFVRRGEGGRRRGDFLPVFSPSFGGLEEGYGGDQGNQRADTAADDPSAGGLPPFFPGRFGFQLPLPPYPYFRHPVFAAPPPGPRIITIGAPARTSGNWGYHHRVRIITGWSPNRAY